MIRLGGLEWSRTLAAEFWYRGLDERPSALAQRDIEANAIDRIGGARELPRVASSSSIAANDAAKL